MDRLVSRIHDRFNADALARGHAAVGRREADELSRRVEALQRMDSCFSHVCLSGFTEESDSRRVVPEGGKGSLAVVPA